MLSPEMRERLKQRARGRRHSEATKLKIRETARASRGHAKQRKKKNPAPFVFSPDVVAQLNERVQSELETQYKESPDHPGRYMVREKKAMPVETREKLSRRIKAMWMDPEYRSKVADGIEQRQIKLAKDRAENVDSLTIRAKAERKAKVRKEVASSPGVDGPKRRVRSASKQKQSPTPDAAVKQPPAPAKLEDESEQEDDGEELTEQVPEHDIVLDLNSLSGWTKEELGIFGSHDAGTVETHVGGSANGDDFDSKSQLSSQLGSTVPKDFGRRVDSMDAADLLRPLKDAGQIDPVNPEAMGEGAGDGLTRLAAHFDPRHDAPFDSLELRNSNANQAAYGREDAAFADGDVDGFLDGPVDLMSTSAADVASPFLSIASEIDRLSSAPRDDFEFNGDDNLLGVSGSSEFMSNKFSVNYPDETLGGLDMYDEMGQTFDTSPRSSPLFGLERPGGNLAQNSGKTK